MLSVGPPQTASPQTGSASDLKVESKINLHDPKFKEFKAEFNKQLKKSVDKRDSDQKSLKEDGKIAFQKESKSDRSDGKKKPDDDKEEPSGGIKKKMVNPEVIDPNLISIIMDSKESEVEIPDFENNLGPSEDPQISVVANEVKNKLGEQNQIAGLEPAVLQPVDPAASEPIVTPQVEFSAESQKTQPILALSVDQPDVDVQAVAQIWGAETVEPEPVVAANKPEAAIESLQPQGEVLAELSAEVIDAPESKLDFQKKILETLKRDQFEAKSAAQGAGGTNTTEIAQAVLMKSDVSHDGSDPSTTDDLTDSVKPEGFSSDKILHLGSNTDSFKSHLMSPIDKAGPAAGLSKMEDIQDPNVKELLSQARYLVTKGGGEMTLRMSPEGMGEVQLRVLLDNGKVNIEMNTQDKSVKKLIEESLSDLKSSLASHQMSIEHVKLNNNVVATNTENSTQSQQNWNQDESGQHAQKDFWKQMQDNAQDRSRKASYQEVGSVGHSRVQQRPEPLQQARQQAAQKYYGGGNKGATLNAVA